MAFEKPADAALLGGWQERWCTLQWLFYPWAGSAVWQWVRVFKEAEIPQGSEVAKTQLLPADEDLTVIYLDSYDQLRRFKKGCEEVVKAEMSERHKRFLKVCEKLALPLNDGKRLVASTLGALQGGVLDGEEGRFGLSVQKMVEVITSPQEAPCWPRRQVEALCWQGDLRTLLQAAAFRYPGKRVGGDQCEGQPERP